MALIRLTKKLDREFSSVESVASSLGVTRQRVLHLLRRGRFVGAKKVGGRWLIPDDAVLLPNPTRRGPKRFTKATTN